MPAAGEDHRHLSVAAPRREVPVERIVLDIYFGSQLAGPFPGRQLTRGVCWAAGIVGIYRDFLSTRLESVALTPFIPKC